VNTLVLRLKAAESFLEISQCTSFTEKSALRDMKSRFYPVLAKILINRIRIKRGLLHIVQFYFIKHC